uniref:Mediator of RNA polymerase II transcription subunit 10 n=1 Tax=Steinernema glaseri TaxID=37863 RepID=A0A1I7YDK6_9BILA
MICFGLSKQGFGLEKRTRSTYFFRDPNSHSGRIPRSSESSNCLVTIWTSDCDLLHGSDHIARTENKRKRKTKNGQLEEAGIRHSYSSPGSSASTEMNTNDRFTVLEKKLEEIQTFFSSPGSSASTEMNTNDRFTVLEKKLEEIQETARTVGLIASEFQSNGQRPLNQSVRGLTSLLQELDAMKSQFADVKVPLGLLECIHNGKNPNLYTREMLLRTSEKNQQANGKTQLYTKFRANLLSELGQELPEEIMKYLDVRGTPEGNRK